jgi:hypothetical protein
MSSEEFRKMMLDELKEFVEDADDKVIKWFQERTYYTAAILTTIKNSLAI